MTARLGRQGPPSDPGRDGCGPPWAMFAAALTFLAVAVILRAVWEVLG